MSKKSAPFDKYVYYQKAVQNPQNEIEFFNDKFKKIRKRLPYTLREDFCGTGMITCHWVKQSTKHMSWGIDLDPEPLEYGKNNHFAPLTTKEQSRVHFMLDNVLSAKTPKVDICFAFNFSYFIFKQRADLLNYFKAARKALNEDGVFFIDLFGGPDSQTVMTDIMEHDTFDYFWDCQEFNPINNHCKFAIHFKPKGQKKHSNVFVYDWRLWSMSELRDLLMEAGFSKSIAYWEGEDGEGGGDGEFYPTEVAENCEAWVTYIAALK